MCDYVPGEMIFSFPRDESVEELMRLWFDDDHHGAEYDMELVETLDDAVRTAGAPPESLLETSLTSWLIRTMPGEEIWAANVLRQRYQEVITRIRRVHPRVDLTHNLLTVRASLNHYLSLPSAPSGTARRGPISVELTAVHSQYKELLGVGDIPDSSATVAIIDSGIADGVRAHVTRRLDFIRHRIGEDVPSDRAVDRYGHGSIVAAIVSDVVPGARLLVYKIADVDAAATEWELCAALGATGDADVINLSVAFGLDKPDCSTCGRRSNSSRSIILEDMLQDLDRAPRKPIVVAAAGNRSARQLAYPARFGNVVATGSLTSTLVPSSFTDTGAVTHSRGRHRNLYFLPGGETKGSQEFVGIASNGNKFAGTSFACAYATSVIASRRGQGSSEQAMEYLREHSVHDIPGFVDAVHGNGRLFVGDQPRKDSDTVIW